MHTIYEIVATLEGSSPAIYREVQIPSHFTLRFLHEIFQAVFSWENFHRHFFKNLAGEHFQNEDEISLKDAFSSDSIILYVYDFGNAWTLRVEKIKENKEDQTQRYPICIGGKRKAPPEDSGGIVGYQMALEILSKKDTKEALLLYDWYGERFDPEDFDSDEVNELLKGLQFI